MKFLSLKAAVVLAGAAAAAGTAAAAALHWDPRTSAMLIRGVFSGAGKMQPSQPVLHLPRGSVTSHMGLRYLGSAVNPSLDLFLPASASAPLPVVVWVHGGAWISGSKKDVEPYLRVLAGYGYAVVGLGYTISPKACYPTAVRELNSALGYLREHAQKYGLDPDRIVLAGDSAGAQLAAQLALGITSPDYARLTGIVPAAAPEHLRGIVLNCGLYDFKSVARLTGTFGWGLKKALWSYTGSKDWAATEAAGHMSIFEHANGKFPPAYIAAGNSDPLTENQSLPLADRLEELGVPVTRRFWPRDYRPALGHEYQFRLDRPEARQTLQETVRFLDTVTRPTAQAQSPSRLYRQPAREKISA
ncbi:alpha/beta hydrolase [Arthrobacter sp. zg-Y20]|uniref:alpha/beta hydrolase n=1 Tax=unclassified Arthrobacter TaxID=235627 RepID=UPI001D13F164|nr:MULTISPECIES: alpha/beta hydrolase [unclassified Arthrobacter]MCC3277393.1 alpha/beta hydrolase [Arthrobacter sp. zg-Y20]MDK1317553.1 alpha/beta hydrolase [Arthrobacter sp. zg.Y20]WIB06950.1 alpha/beta hydrolase [Arthrobacter sp. zg-Y20]